MQTNMDFKRSLPFSYWVYGCISLSTLPLLPAHAGIVPEMTQPVFKGAVNIRSGRQTTSVVVRDLNRDGKPDIATVNQGIIRPDVGVLTYGNLTLLMGKGNGQFEPLRSVPTSSALPTAIASGDINGDGNADLLVANSDGRNVTVYLGHGDGTFEDGMFSFPIDGPQTLAVADFDGDGLDDVMVGTQSGEVSLMPGFYDGTLMPPQKISSHGSVIATSDFNADGLPDLAVSGPESADVEVLLGTGGGQFQTVKGGANLSNMKALTVADLNSDKKPDLVGTGAVAMGVGDGTFGRPVEFDSDIFSDSVLAEDLDGDNNREVIIGNQVKGTVSVFPGKGDGSFGRPRRYVAGYFPISMGIADFNGDSTLDLAVGNVGLGGRGNVSLLLGDAGGSFHAAPSIDTTDSSDLVSADFNKDGKLDLAVANAIGSANDTVTVFMGNGDGTYGETKLIQVGESPTALGLGDYNGDGLADLAVSVIGDHTVKVLLGKGDGTFQLGESYEVGDQPTDIKVTDLNGDGEPDLIVADSAANDVSLLFGQAGGHFKAGTRLATGATPVSVDAGDFNGDGKTDFAVACVKSSEVTLFLNQGEGSFDDGTFVDPGLTPVSLHAADFNGDGKLDLITVSSTSDTINFLKGKGDGTFEMAVSSRAGKTPFASQLDDFNGDGKLDVAVGSYDGVGVLVGAGDGTFQATVDYAAGRQPSTLTSGDFNGDGRPDLAAGSIWSVSFLLNEGGTALQGDVNGDGKVTLADTILTLRYAIGETRPNDTQLKAADMDGDGKVSINDAITILHKSTGL